MFQKMLAKKEYVVYVYIKLKVKIKGGDFEGLDRENAERDFNARIKMYEGMFFTKVTFLSWKLCKIYFSSSRAATETCYSLFESVKEIYYISQSFQLVKK